MAASRAGGTLIAAGPRSAPPAASLPAAAPPGPAAPPAGRPSVLASATGLSSQAVVAEQVAEVARKAAVLWIVVPGHRPRAAWVLWRDGRTYLLTGPGEQDVPGLADATEVTVTTGAVSWTATVSRDTTDEAFAALAAKRLNGHPDRATAVVHALTPAG
jgi:hypothetical protein